MATGDQSTITIEEITGDAKRKLVLVGPGLPFRGAAWETETRMTTTWYPGNSVEATQQVLVNTQLPSTWEGRWSRSMLGHTPCLYSEGGGSPRKVVSPIFLMDALNAIQAGGFRLRVTWTRPVSERNGPGDSFRIMREGRIKNFRPAGGYADDLEWSITFEWQGIGSGQKVVATREGNLEADLRALSSVASEVAGLIEQAKIIQAKRDIKNSVTEFTLGQLEALVDAPLAIADNFARELRQITSDLNQFGDIVQKVRALPSSLANVGVNMAQNTMAICNQFVDDMSRRPAETNVLDANVKDLVSQAKVFGSYQSSAEDLIDRAQKTMAGIRSTRSTNAGGSTPTGGSALTSTILAVHVSKEGDTIPALSSKFYKTPDYAANIAAANHLPWHQVDLQRGRLIIIPVIAGLYLVK